MLYQTENPHGGEVYSRPVSIDFSANINPYGTPPAVKQAVVDAMELLCQYPDPYCRELVAAIADHEGVPKEYIFCGNGAADLIFSLCMAKRPRKAMVLAPCFSEYETALTAAGAQIDHYYLHQEDAFCLTEAFLPVLSQWDGEMLMLCNPNNPTGQTIDPALLGEILAICEEKGIFLFVDECFLDLTQGGEGLSLKGQLAGHRNLFLLKAFTKSYGMAGLRLGYCLCSDSALLKKMGSATQVWNVSIPAQMAGVAALGQQAFLARANELIHAERPRMAAALEQLGFTVIPSRTNYILFHADRELRSPLEERGILIRSCANYYGLGQGWYRVAVKLPEQNDALLAALAEVLGVVR